MEGDAPAQAFHRICQHSPERPAMWMTPPDFGIWITQQSQPGHEQDRDSDFECGSVDQRREVPARARASGGDDLEQVAQQYRAQVCVKLAEAGQLLGR